MKQHRNSRLQCVAVLGAGIVLAGCKANNGLPPGAGAEPALPPPPVVVPPADSSPSQPAATLSASITSDKKTYARGQIVRFTLTLRNTGKDAQKLTFNSGQSFDITATPAGQSQPVWRWSNGKMFTMALRDVTIKGGETQRWTATWEQTDSNGHPAPRAEYSVVGRITANGGIDTPPLVIALTN